MDAWRDVLRDREVSVVDLCRKLDSSAWQEKPHGPSGKYFGVLLAALHELDRDIFVREVDRLNDIPLHPLHRKTLEILSRRQNDKPVTQVGGGIPVYVADEISEPDLVADNVRRWSRVRGLNLDEVTRIDVLARHPALDFLGCYDVQLSGIVLTWPVDRVSGIRLWWRRLDAEHTFYHEVGHHACGHLEGGQVATQEAEANVYAVKMMLRARPPLRLLLVAVLWPLVLWQRRSHRQKA
ncbi:hypothetical protein EF888_01070 [Silicimonas algicola]|nr:hypothetical protein [Silicimonas algicola]AZQ65846.1 hypothetical protein EF888_01070 [Silicimonas algicola]